MTWKSPKMRLLIRLNVMSALWKQCQQGSSNEGWAKYKWFRRNLRKCFEKNGGDDETRTRDLCRDSGPLIGFTTTYKTAGTAKGRLSRSESYKTLRAVGWVVG